MQRVVIDIPDNKINFFMELFSSLGIKKTKQLSNEQIEFVDDLKHSIREVEQHEKGNVQLQTADDFLNEL